MKLSKKRRQQRADLGMTLPELLVSVTLTAILATSLALATNVMLSNKDNVLGRANNSRSEQNVGLFMPTDLASSESEDTAPDAVPCGPTSGPDHLLGTADDIPAPPCPSGANIGGSNALQLTWSSSVIVGGNPVNTTTKVSYRVLLVGAEYMLIRVRCDVVNGGSPTCYTQIVLHDLTPPPVGVTFVAGVTKPDWIITVSKATDPLDPSGPSATPVVDPGLKNKNGQRVVVTVNGGGGGSSASGGQSQIFLSAGGTNRQVGLSSEDLSGAPTFTAARSRCGGNMGMIVDTSNSITNPQMASIKSGIQSFLNEFAGTPVKLQIVTFATTGVILGSAAGEPKWYDMLVDSDVQALKNLVGDPANAASGIRQNGGTNWEDGFIRMLRNVDGTVPPQMPSKVIFFTDGVPTFSRLNATSSTAPATPNALDNGLPLATGASYAQVGWNRAERVVRDRGKVDMIGIFVGTLPAAGAHTPNTAATDPAYESWTMASAGYHWTWERADTVQYQKGYHLNYQRGNNVVYERGSHIGPQVGNNVVWERGYHVDYKVGNNVVWERGSHLDYQRSSNVTYQYATSGMAFERWRTSTSQWVTENSPAASTYLSNNTTPDSSDNHRAYPTGSLGGWTNITKAQYDASNTVAGQTDGFRTVYSGSPGTWTSITQADYNLNNTTPSDATDGFQTATAYSAPFDTWSSVTQATYDTAGNNSTIDSSDGWRTRQTSPSSSWNTTTAAQYNASNSTADSSDGWQAITQYSTPYSAWEPSTQATYDTSGNNSTVDSSDGWRTRQTSPSTSWITVTTAQYNASNSTADASDGWQMGTDYSAPFSTWTSTTSTLYDTPGNNSTVDSSDGWRTRQTATSTTWTNVTQGQYAASNSTVDATDGWQIVNAYSSPFDLWEATTQAIYETNNSSSAPTDGWQTALTATPTAWITMTQTQYNASNTTADETDGWRYVKSYTPPSSLYDVTTKDISAIDLLGNVVVGDLSGNTGSYNRVDAPTGGAPYADNAATAADVFALPDYSYFAQALDKIVLGECGGTVTLQTKNTADQLGAKDPFTYENTTDHTVVKTSAAFKSGTFDVAFPGSNAKTIVITPQEFTNLSAWSHVSWACKSKGVAYPFTETPVPNHTAWTSIQLVVHANEAISCTQMVSYHG
ncbi:MAG: hypothetical protein QOE09_2388 [Ilumatobacteraceae bacterium]|jgi:hypothetical protein